MENLRHLTFAPSVQMHQVPHDLILSSDDEDGEDKDQRITRNSLS